MRLSRLILALVFQIVSALQKFDLNLDPDVSETASSPGLRAADVLFVVRTYSGNYETRLNAIMQTWGAQVDPSRLFVIGDSPSEKFPVHAFPDCNQSHNPAYIGLNDVVRANHELACRVAQTVLMAADIPDWSVIFFADDDHYVRTDKLTQLFAKYTGSAPTAFGVHGCGVLAGYCHGKGGFCGGEGFGFNRAAINALIGASPFEYLQQYEEIRSSSILSNGNDDIALPCVVRSRVPDVVFEQYHIQGPDNMRPEEAASAGDDNLIMHRVDADNMIKLHAAFQAALL